MVRMLICYLPLINTAGIIMFEGEEGFLHKLKDMAEYDAVRRMRYLLVKMNMMNGSIGNLS